MSQDKRGIAGHVPSISGTCPVFRDKSGHVPSLFLSIFLIKKTDEFLKKNLMIFDFEILIKSKRRKKESGKKRKKQKIRQSGYLKRENKEERNLKAKGLFDSRGCLLEG